MRLLYLKYRNTKYQHPLNDFEQTFRSPSNLNSKINPLALVGINGSGKSKLLEVLAEIFIYLHAIYDEFLDKPEDPNIEFNIEYTLRKDGQWLFVRVNKSEDPFKVKVFKGKNIHELEEVKNVEEVSEILPIVVGYSSGENETLSNFFQPYSEQYAEYYQSSALSKIKTKKLPPLPQFLWLDFTMNKKVFLANAILSNDTKWKAVKDEIRLESVHSFRLTIQLKPRSGPVQGIIPAIEQQEIIDKLTSCATMWEEDSRRNKVILDFYLNDATIEQFRYHFKSTFDLYLAFNQLDLLNHVVIRSQIAQIKRILKSSGESIKIAYPFDDEKAFNLSHILIRSRNKEIINYKDLSDGEHQFLHVFGSLLMVNPNNTLFLMDEPETHFNPQWRSAFISIMSKLVYGRYQEYLITTHSPFILSDSKRENVLIFEKQKTGIKIKKPDFQTYGAAIDNLLHMAFGISPPVALKSQTEIKKLSENKEISREELENKLGDYGDSFEKLALYQRLQELRNEESKK